MKCKYTGEHQYSRIIETKLIQDGWKYKREESWYWRCDHCTKRFDNKTPV